jgi:hypothetical protein
MFGGEESRALTTVPMETAMQAIHHSFHLNLKLSLGAYVARKSHKKR